MHLRGALEHGIEVGMIQRPPKTLVVTWMPRAPSWPMARSISSSAAATLFIGSAATKAGKRSGHCSTMRAMPSLAMRAKPGDSSGPPSASGGGSESVSTCCTSGNFPSISTRASRSHSRRRLVMRLTMPASFEWRWMSSR
jgi:hypothetical protein